jgi:hypothetical protein
MARLEEEVPGLLTVVPSSGFSTISVTVFGPSKPYSSLSQSLKPNSLNPCLEYNLRPCSDAVR